MTIFFGLILWQLSRYGLWYVAAGIITIIELWLSRQHGIKARFIARLPYILAALAAGLIIDPQIKSVTQIVIAVVYSAWRLTAASNIASHDVVSPVHILLLQVGLFQAMFLSVAIKGTSPLIILVTLWITSFFLAFIFLRARGERSAMVLASIWSLIVVECSWLFMVWLVTYVLNKSYIIVPQPVLVLSALAYCLGSVYIAQRENSLSKLRLAEYVCIMLVIVGIVALGTPWKGSI